MKTCLLLCLFAALVCTGDARGEAPLFAGDAQLELTIPIDFDTLCRPRESEECDFAPTVLSYRDEAGREHSLPIEIRVRGGWRSLSRNCSTPLLWVKFSQADVAGTPFEGQSLLPLTTHCGKGLSVESLTRPIRHSDFEQYLLREFLGHRIYSVLTDQSVSSRLVRVAYPEPGRPDRLRYHFAFFTEHFDDLAARTGYQRLPRGSFDHRRLDAQAAARVALFQFLIGNTDWSIARERNTVLMQNAEGTQVPVPYDLDMSGLVAAGYAGPPPGLPIDDVRERYFLGYCQPGTAWDSLFAEFDSKRDMILALTEQVPGLDHGSKRWSRRYLEGFFDVIDSSAERQEEIVDACRPWPPSPVDHTTPLDKS